MKTTQYTKMDELRGMTDEQINERYPASKVAQGLVDKLSLKGQVVAPRRKLTAAERRRAIQVGRLALAIAASRRAA